MNIHKKKYSNKQLNSHNSIVGLNVSQFYAYAMCQDMAKISVENFLFVEEIYERNLFFNEFDIPEAECVGEPVERSIRRFEKKSQRQRFNDYLIQRNNT